MTIGFKEWALVCEALGRGEQSILLRKGGIREGRAGFQFQHDEFFLFPTLFHEQVTKTRLPPETAVPGRQPGLIEIQLFARALWTEVITDWRIVQALKPFHIWSEAELETRFHYKNAGLNLAFIRVYRLREVWSFPDAPKYGGCRSWVNLPDTPADLSDTPVLDNSAHLEIEKNLRRIIS